MEGKKVVRNSILFVLLAIIATQIAPLFRKSLPNAGGGFAAPGWRKVADAFRKNLDSGSERGAGFALYYKGDLVVEFSGGYADEEAEEPWARETISQSFSSSKGVAAIAVATLVDKGYLDYSQTVAHYWPEFAQNGKEKITVEQLLSHQSGLAVIDEPFSYLDELNDPQKVSRILAAQPPNWTPGTAVGYHGHTVGLYMSELVQRVDPRHRNLATYFNEEIAKPLHLEVFFGLPGEVNDRVTRVYDLNLFSFETLTATRYWPVIWTFMSDSQSLTTRSITNPSGGNFNSHKFQEIRNPSHQAFGTAESFAKLFGIVANGGMYKGKRVLAPEVAARLVEPQKSGYDLVLKMDLTYGRGTTIRKSPLGSSLLGAPGAGGQMIYADLDHKLGWSYLTNHHSVFAIGDDPRYLALEAAIYECIEKIEAKNRGHS